MFLYNHMAVFACITREGSITKASQKLELPKSTVSLKLKELEEQLGVRLIQRTTRVLTLTEEGRLFYEQCQEMLDAGNAATSMMQGLQDEPRGTLKITCPFGSTATLMPKVISLYSLRYPKVKLQVISTNERLDIVAQGIDIAMRFGTLEDSSLIARKLTECQRWLMASPSYLKKYGEPVKPQDLSKHRCIVSSFAPRWTFMDGKRLLNIEPSPSLRVTDAIMAKKLAIADAGICMLPDLSIQSEIDDGLLIPLMPQYPMEPRDLSLIYPSRKHQSSSIKHFIETALEVFQENKASPRKRT